MSKLFGDLTDEKGKLKVNGFYDYVEQITPDEEKIYENIQEFDPAEIRLIVSIQLLICSPIIFLDTSYLRIKENGTK